MNRLLLLIQICFLFSCQENDSRFNQLLSVYRGYVINQENGTLSEEEFIELCLLVESYSCNQEEKEKTRDFVSLALMDVGNSSELWWETICHISKCNEALMIDCYNSLTNKRQKELLSWIDSSAFDPMMNFCN